MAKNDKSNPKNNIEKINRAFFSHYFLEQKIMVFISFLLTVGLTTYILFQIDFSSLIDISLATFSANIIYIFIILFAFNTILRHTMIAIKYKIISYVLAFLLMLYCYLIVFLKIDFNLGNYHSIILELLWTLPIFIFNFLWKLLFFFIEFKWRPFFAWNEFYKSCLIIVIVSTIVIVLYLIDQYLMLRNYFDYKSFPKIFLFCLIGLFFLIIAGLGSAIMTQRVYLKSEIKVLHVNRFWISILHFLPLLIWLVFNLDLKFNNNWNYLFISLCLLVLITFTFIVRSKQDIGGGSKLFSIIYSVSYFLLSLIMFVFYQWFFLDLALILIVTSLSILYILFISILISPIDNFLTALVLKIFTLLLSIIFIILGTLKLVTGNTWELNILNIPFSIIEIILLIPLLLTAILILINVVFLLYTMNQIKIQSFKLNNFYRRKLLGVKHE